MLCQGATVVSSEDGKYTVAIEVDGCAEDEVLEDLDASVIVVPAETFKAGPIDARLVGHSKGITQNLLERGVIKSKSKLKALCATWSRHSSTTRTSAETFFTALPS